MIDFNRLLQDYINVKLLREKRAMATRNTTPTVDVNDIPDYAATVDNAATEENEFAMPEEFADDPAPIIAHTPSAQSTVSSAGSLDNDEFENSSFDDEKDELERAKLNPPTGDWKKEDSWDYERQVISDDSMPGDFDSSGRTFLVFKGKPVSREANDLNYEPQLRLRISPDKRYKQDKPTEVDTAYKLFLKAKDMYIEKHSEKPGKMAQLRSMLEHDSYVVRTMNGDSGPIIVDLKLKSYQGRNNK